MPPTKKTKETKPSKKEPSDKPAKAKAPKKPSLETKAAKETPEAAPKDKAAKRSKPATRRHPMADRTFFAKPGEVPNRWRLVDAEGLTLGRLSTYLATALMGKDKPSYTRSADTGDFVVVINAEKIVLTGDKWRNKLYKHHTNYPGGLKTFTAEFIRESHPERLIQKAVWRMLPHGHMGRHWFSKLKVYPGTQHPHSAQKPEPVKVAAN